MDFSLGRGKGKREQKEEGQTSHVRRGVGKLTVEDCSYNPG